MSGLFEQHPSTPPWSPGNKNWENNPRLIGVYQVSKGPWMQEILNRSRKVCSSSSPDNASENSLATNHYKLHSLHRPQKARMSSTLGDHQKSNIEIIVQIAFMHLLTRSERQCHRMTASSAAMQMTHTAATQSHKNYVCIEKRGQSFKYGHGIKVLGLRTVCGRKRPVINR